jgi:DNA processing protein
MKNAPQQPAFETGDAPPGGDATTGGSTPDGTLQGTREAWLRLAFVGLPAERCLTALERWGSPDELLAAASAGNDEALLATRGITPKTVERLREAAQKDLARALAAMEAKNIRMLVTGDEDYPVALRGLLAPPPYLFVRGTIEASDEVAVAIVGTRHATEYGRGVAEKFAADLAARGVTVVSGLARGIDAAAHRGALDAGGRTFAVCGCGLDIVYPSDNKQLMDDIELKGAAFSEFAPTVHPESWHFPARNRIISGLSAGVVVVEAGERSGALITSDFALEQGRDVFAVPGNIHKVQSRGAHALIKAGATLVESADDIITALNNRALPFERPATKAKAVKVAQAKRAQHDGPRADLSPTENQIYMALDVEPRHVDEIAAAAQMGAAETNGTLVLLELKGIARRLPGGLFEKKSN